MLENQSYGKYSQITEMSKDELLSTLDNLGYKINKADTFNYFNSANEIHYKAKSCYIVEKDTGLSFANIAARRDNNFGALQNLRYWVDVKHRGIVWEL